MQTEPTEGSGLRILSVPRATRTIPELRDMLKDRSTPHDVVEGLIMQVARRADDGRMSLLMEIGDETRQESPALWSSAQRGLAQQVLVRYCATDKDLIRNVAPATELLTFFAKDARHTKLGGQDLRRLAEFLQHLCQQHMFLSVEFRPITALLAVRIGFYEFLTTRCMLSAIPDLYATLHDRSAHLRNGTGPLTWEGWKRVAVGDDWKRRLFLQDLGDIPGAAERLREDLWRIQVRAGIALAPQECPDENQIACARCLQGLAAIVAHDAAPYLMKTESPAS
ncbi:hypothetical protein HY632_01715 [Candidatus Uhrbacteria bacterium]|nr:hypothetical protein [Candidatus Uhrbacteria bacterium]